jgi:hypothetical protein
MCKCNFPTAGTKSTNFPVQSGYSSVFNSIMYRRLLQDFVHIGRYMWQMCIEFNLRPPVYSVYFTAPIVTELKFCPYNWCTVNLLYGVYSIGSTKKSETFHLHLTLQQYWQKSKLLKRIMPLFPNFTKTGKRKWKITYVVLHVQEWPNRFPRN